MGLIEFLTGLLGSGIGAALIAFLARDWLAIRIKTAVEQEVNIKRAAFELKRDACLNALSVVDGAFSQREWSHDGKKVEALKQPLDIAAARLAYNQLALTCNDPTIVELYVKTLGLREPGEEQKTGAADSVVDLRNAMRKELGFGSSLDFDRSKAWIANLDGAT